MPVEAHLIKWKGFDVNANFLKKNSWNCWNALHCLKTMATKSGLPATGWRLQSFTEAADDCEIKYLISSKYLLEIILSHLSASGFVLNWEIISLKACWTNIFTRQPLLNVFSLSQDIAWHIVYCWAFSSPACHLSTWEISSNFDSQHIIHKSKSPLITNTFLLV